MIASTPIFVIAKACRSASPPSETLTLARRYIDIERPKAALDALSRAPDDDLESPAYWAIRASGLLQLGRFTETADAAERGLER